MADRLRVAIADDHPLFREGVVHTLRSSNFVEVVGEAGSAEDAIRIAREALPDIMLLDVGMPGGGIEAARSIARVCPNVMMIMLTVSESEQDVAQALEAGAMGYVLKGMSGPELRNTILAVWRGKSYFRASLDARLLSLTTRRKPTRLDLTELGSEREMAERLLGHILERSDMAVQLDPAVFAADPDLEHRLRTLVSRAELLRRETGIDGLYMGFPFILAQPRGESVKPRIAPALLWPIRIGSEVGQRGRFSLGFDRDREEVHVNPALQYIFAPNELANWETARDNILAGETSVRAVMDELEHLASRTRQRTLSKLPGPDVRVDGGASSW